MKRECFHKNTNEHKNIIMRVPSDLFKSKYFRIKTQPLTIILLFSLLSFNLYSQENTEVGSSIGIGTTSLINTDIHQYYRGVANSMWDFSLYNRQNLSDTRLSLKSEFISRLLSSDFEFDENVNGRVQQLIMGFNFKASIKPKRNIDFLPFESFWGIGIYLVAQSRTPEPKANLSVIEDNFAYCGVSFNCEFLYSIPIDKYHIGLSWRFFLMPNLTFLNRNNVPEFYHVGNSINIVFGF